VTQPCGSRGPGVADAAPPGTGRAGATLALESAWEVVQAVLVSPEPTGVAAPARAPGRRARWATAPMLGAGSATASTIARVGSARRAGWRLVVGYPSEAPVVENLDVTEHEPGAGAEVVTRLVASRPRLEVRFQRQRFDDDEELPYVQVAALARAVVESFGEGDTEEFGSLFEVVEQILEDGTEYERELVVVGFLEDVQGALGWAGLGLTAFDPWLGPSATTAWNDLIRLWDRIRAKKAAGELPPGPFDHGVPEINDPGLRTIFQSIHRPPGWARDQMSPRDE
jgi:hypothetical protein